MTTLQEQLASGAEADLQRLIDDGVSETEVLDFKGGRYQGDPDAWSAAQEFAKDVAAFANHRGGVIIIGIREKAKVAAELKPLSERDAEQEERLLRQWLAKYTAPTVDISIHEVSSSGGGYYLVVTVPRSEYQPHAVLSDNSRRPLIFPVRDGQDTRYLTEHEVARRYAERMQGEVSRRAAFDRLVGDGADRLDRSSAVWLWLAMRPDQPLDRHLDTATVNAISSWWTGGIEGPLGSRLWAHNAIVGPGCVTFTSHPLRDDDDASDPRDTYLELHADGSSFAALDINLRTSKDNQLGHIGNFTLVDGMIPIVDVVARWAVEVVGGTGTATVAVGLIDTTEQRAPIEMVADEYGELRRVRATRPLRRSSEVIVTRDDTTADLSACTDFQGRLALAHTCLSFVLQRFGRPEPEQLTSDGQLVWRQWKRFPDVKRWGESYGAPLADGMGPNLLL